MSTVLFVHHDPNSLPGLVGEAFTARGWDLVEYQVGHVPGSPEGDPAFPAPDRFDAVVVFGSRWSVYDPACSHWVEPERAMLLAADTAGVPVLGCCFGGQVLAWALGGDVGPADRPEIGWFEVEPVPVDPAVEVTVEPGPWLQWHGDGFTVPEGAVELARSSAGCQAFVLRRNLGVQFHPEVDRAVLEAWLVDDAEELLAVGIDPADLLAGADLHRDGGRDRASRLVDRFLDDVARR